VVPGKKLQFHAVKIGKKVYQTLNILGGLANLANRI